MRTNRHLNDRRPHRGFRLAAKTARRFPRIMRLFTLRRIHSTKLVRTRMRADALPLSDPGRTDAEAGEDVSHPVVRVSPQDNISVRLAKHLLQLVDLRATRSAALPTMLHIKHGNDVSTIRTARLPMPLDPDEATIPEVLNSELTSDLAADLPIELVADRALDRKSTRLNSSHT